MPQQMSLLATVYQFSYTSLSAEEKSLLLSDPESGARMAISAMRALLTHLKSSISVSSALTTLDEKKPKPTEDMLFWLNFIQRHPYIKQIRLDDTGKYLYQKAEFLLTVVHLVAWNDMQNACFMLGEKIERNAMSTPFQPQP